MKKGIEWLKEEIGDLPITDTVFISDGLSYIDSAVPVMAVYDLIDKLDEPEVLSHKWISDHIIFNEKEDAEYIYADKLQNLLVPKQESPVIPKLVADWIDENRGQYENRFFTIGYDLYDNAIHRAVGDWIIEKEEKFVEAWFGAYEIEKEQKYYVNLDTAAYVAKWDGDDQIDIYTDAISGKDEYEFHLTEQEIKGFDERFWPFAEPIDKVV